MTTVEIIQPGPWLATNGCSVPECTGKHNCRGFCRKHYLRFKKHGTPTPAHMEKTEADRFWEKVAKAGPDDCWLWTAGRRGPYGMFNVPPTTIGAHRYAYILAHGEIPDGALIDHTCRVKLCVNPAHLQLADHSLNGQNLNGATVRSKSGVRGVWWDAINRRWVGQVSVAGKTHSAGHHHTLEEAAAAVLALRNELHTNNLADREKP